MNENQFIKKDSTVANKFNNGNPGHSNQQHHSFIQEKREISDDVVILNGAVASVSIYLIAIIFFAILLNLKDIRQGIKNKISKLQINQDFPCKNCRFFQQNSYLKCAVHPYTVLTKEATNCSDYWTEAGKFIS